MKIAKEFLTQQGFYRYELPSESGYANRKVLYQRRIENVTPLCRSNDRLHLSITLSESSVQGIHHTSADAYITGEMPDGEWAKLSFYSIKLDELPAKLANLEQRLIKAWEASCSLTSAEPNSEKAGT